jgi:hypothetical protein
LNELLPAFAFAISQKPNQRGQLPAKVKAKSSFCVDYFEKQGEELLSLAFGSQNYPPTIGHGKMVRSFFPPWSVSPSAIHLFSSQLSPRVTTPSEKFCTIA